MQCGLACGSVCVHTRNKRVQFFFQFFTLALGAFFTKHFWEFSVEYHNKEERFVLVIELVKKPDSTYLLLNQILANLLCSWERNGTG